jgi:hypothetical protein
VINTEAAIDPKVSALVYVAARAPDADEDYAALANGSRHRPPLAVSSGPACATPMCPSATPFAAN